MWAQSTVRLKPRRRGFHLVTDEVVAAVPEITRVRVGLASFFLQHTSASLTITENADPDVRTDLESHFDRAAPEDAPYVHDAEGPDDMPAHIKSATIGVGLTIPISQGRLALGTWQGICLCEHRDEATARTVVVTVTGE
jgi:secondary thiamine-phosphate synthase enzyme